ncbi:MAG: hypothetical protein IPG69_20645 [Flavobacteriales bacterium]|nr:hypothetical protein [Flavobacteriales bacterium]
MAKHAVSFSLPERSLGKADAQFKVYEDGELLGTLAISIGSIVWFPKGTQYGCKMSWRKFHAVMEKHAPPYEKR